MSTESLLPEIPLSKCPYCKEDYIPELCRYCSWCGRLLPLPGSIEDLGVQEMLEACEHNIRKESGYKFCSNCGKKL